MQLKIEGYDTASFKTIKSTTFCTDLLLLGSVVNLKIETGSFIDYYVKF